METATSTRTPVVHCVQQQVWTLSPRGRRLHDSTVRVISRSRYKADRHASAPFDSYFGGVIWGQGQGLVVLGVFVETTHALYIVSTVT
eukprot:5771910-Prymnesium_polylepis.1